MEDNVFLRTVLSNGIRVVTEYVPGTTAVSVGVWVDAGSRDEPAALSGISHFIEHMIFKGTKKRSALEIAKIFDRLGGFSNAFTSKEITCFHAKVLQCHLDTILDLLADIFLNSVFHPEEIMRERQVILQEISMVEDSPDDLIHDLFTRNYWKGNGVERSILGTPETISSMSSEMLKQYVHDCYVGERLVIAAAGAVEHYDFVSKVEKLFSAVPASSKVLKTRQEPEPHFGFWSHEKDLEQTHILMGVPGPSAGHPERYKYLLMNVILGGSMSSRLFQEIREKYGLAYAVYSFLSSLEDCGVQSVYAGTSPEHVLKLLELILVEMEKLAENSLDHQELAAAKDHVKGGLLLTAENSDSRMSKIARDELVLGRFVPYQELVEKIHSVSKEDIRQCAEDCLSNGMAVTLLGKIPAGLEERALKLFKNRLN